MNPMHKAIDLSAIGARYDGPFGAVVVRGSEIVGQGFCSTRRKHDPTAHAIILAIREAARFLRCENLDACKLYTSCEPCPMCVGAIYQAGITEVHYAATRQDVKGAICGSNEHDPIAWFSEADSIEFIQSKDPERAAARLVIDAWKTIHTPNKDT